MAIDRDKNRSDAALRGRLRELAAAERAQKARLRELAATARERDLPLPADLERHLEDLDEPEPDFVGVAPIDGERYLLEVELSTESFDHLMVIAEIMGEERIVNDAAQIVAWALATARRLHGEKLLAEHRARR
jgi:hypothetical protein